MTKISIQYKPRTFVGKWTKTIDVKRSMPFYFKSYQYVSEWVTPKIVMPSKTWLERQRILNEEPFEA